MITSEIALLDTNVLVYCHQALSRFHSQSRILLERGLNGEIALSICPQVLFEFFTIITNPRRVTNPVDSAEATAEMENYLKAKNILKVHPKENTLEIALDLLKKYRIRQSEIFDLQLVATMLSSNITRLYTYNLDHFVRFTEIEVISP
jgi:toxin-antitoxin system PIN domain toxin